MKMYKRLLALLLALTMLLLCACGDDSSKNDDRDDDRREDVSQSDTGDQDGNNDVEDKEEISFDPKDVVTITFAHTLSTKLQAVLNDYIVEFNKIYPNIHIQPSSYGGYQDTFDQIQSMIVMGQAPNVAICYPEHVAAYNTANATVALDDFIDHSEYGLTDAQKADFVTAFYNEGKVYGDGKMYTLPMSKSTEVLYYNKTFFNQYGLKVPTTWDEMWQVCAQIKAMDPSCIPLGYDDEANWFITMCKQMDTDYISAKDGGQFLFDNAGNRAWMKELRGYYQQGLFTTQDLFGSYTSELLTGSYGYMSIGSSGGASYNQAPGNEFEVGVAPVPQMDPADPKAVSQGPNLCILKNADTTDQELMASWLFIQFLSTNADFQMSYSMTSGYMPVIKSATRHASYSAWLSQADGYNGLVARTVQASINNFSSYFVPPAFNGSSIAREQVGDLMVKCLDGPSVDIDKAFKDAIEECEN